jgi:hypothetical protein
VRLVKKTLTEGPYMHWEYSEDTSEQPMGKVVLDVWLHVSLPLTGDLEDLLAEVFLSSDVGEEELSLRDLGLRV